ncbi:YwqG family protein [Leptotrichia massiliensis]|uniref:YwqG family protein n=1 Tax=Leptotrichia massiliensis TaxID=1852388 RepID=UPI0028D3513C|nr:YwqG family protein [Leptotrichia massiliensis]
MEEKELKISAKDIFKEIEKKYQETAKEMMVADASVSALKEIKITDSKIEGIPYIPKGRKIPTNSKGQQFMFLAQINCEDLKGLEDFPQEGILQFWVLGEDLLGLDFDDYTNRDGFDVIYYEKIEDYYSEDEFKEMYNPYKFDLKYMEILIASEPCKMKFSLEKQKESFNYELLDNLFKEVLEEESLGFNEKDKLYEEVEKLYDDEFYEEIVGTKCNGFPYFTQWEPRDDKQMKEYDTSLFQIDSGKEVMIGDSGVMHFFINREKLKNKDFSDVFYHWDCY